MCVCDVCAGCVAGCVMCECVVCVMCECGVCVICVWCVCTWVSACVCVCVYACPQIFWKRGVFVVRWLSWLFFKEIAGIDVNSQV